MNNKGSLAMKTKIISVVLTLALFGGVSSSNAETYTLTDLGIAGLGSATYAINDADQVAGWSQISGPTFLETIWNRKDQPTCLPPLPGPAGSDESASAINEVGQVAGISFISGVGYATVWKGTIPTFLPPLPGGSSSYATGINNAGKVVGYDIVTNSNGNQIAARPIIWNGTTPTALGKLPGSELSIASAINNHGHAAGYICTRLSSYLCFATLWVKTTPTALGTLAGYSYATAIK